MNYYFFLYRKSFLVLNNMVTFFAVFIFPVTLRLNFIFILKMILFFNPPKKKFFFNRMKKKNLPFFLFPF